MKKILVLSLLCLYFSPSYAQKNFWRGLTHWTRPAAFNTKIESSIFRARGRNVPLAGPHIQIANLPGEPLVKLGTTDLPQDAGVLPARLLTGDESHKALFPGEGFFPPMYVPVALNTQEEVVYRGLKLYNLQDLQNILNKGLQYNKVSDEMNRKIYFSGTLRRAARYAVEYRSPQQELPVLVKFTVPNKDLLNASPYVLGWDYYYALRNIPAGHIQDVMVLLEVNGQPGWYKAVLEDGKPVFIPAPSQVFKDEDLIEHDLGVYDDY